MAADTHFFEMANGYGLPHDPLNAIIGPRPIGWISSRAADGSVNLAPYSFFNAFNYRPPILGFCSNGRKDTLRNIEETREFVWNLVVHPLAEKMNQTSAAFEHGIDEFESAGLQKSDSRLVNVPRVCESPVNFECKLCDIVQLKDHQGRAIESWLVIGEVVAGHIKMANLKDGIFQTFSSDIILRAGGPSSYAKISAGSEFKLVRPNQSR